MPTDASADAWSAPEQAGGTSARTRAMRRAAFALIAAFIFVGPAPGQLFGMHSPFLREWIMFSGGGTGFLSGDFIVSEGETEISRHGPLEAAGIESYPLNLYDFRWRVFEEDQLPGFAAALCNRLEPGQHLAFVGATGTRQGWREMSSETVCAGEEAGE